MLKNMLFELLFPPKCVLCGAILMREETDLCRDCRVDAPVFPESREKLPFLDSWTSVWYYEGNVRNSILRYKFHRARHYAAAYGRLLAMRILRDYPDGFDVLSWVPISPLRKVKRGYDQVELLAAAVGRELGMKPERTLRKVRHNRPQSGITERAQRKANVLGVYRPVRTERFRDKRVLMIDDIITSGATAGEAARTLLTAGAKEVHCGTIAAARNR